MKKRIQKFKCLAIKPVVRNMDVLYRRQAMEIIHWMTVVLQVMVLALFSSFQNCTTIAYYRAVIVTGYGSLRELH